MDLTAVQCDSVLREQFRAVFYTYLPVPRLPKNYFIFFLNFAIFGNIHASFFRAGVFTDDKLEFRHIAVNTHAHVINNNGQIRCEVLELCALDNLGSILFGSRKGLFMVSWYL
jgi:hypothetical protein